jgi:hypothetical protein
MTLASWLLPSLGILSFATGCTGSVSTSQGSGATPPPEAPAGCAFDGTVRAGQPVMALSTGTTIAYVYGDASVRPVHTFVAPQPGAVPSAGNFAVAGGHVAASIVWMAGTNSPIQRERVMLDEDGAVLWQTVEGPLTSGIESWFLDEGGSLVATWDDYPPGADVVPHAVRIAADGSQHAFDGRVVVGPADGSGAVPVTHIDGFGLDWLMPDSSLRPFADLPSPAQATPIRLLGRLWYPGVHGGTPALVSATSADTQVLDLPGVDASQPVDIAGTAQSGWVLAKSGDQRWRVDASAKTAPSSIVLSPPAGLRTLSYTGPTLDDAGQVVLPLRDDAAGGVYVSPDGSTGWSRVGDRFTGVLAVEVSTRGGTYVLAGTNDRYVGETWANPPPADAVNGIFVELVRPSAGVTRLLSMGATSLEPPFQPSLSGNGLCAAWNDRDAPGSLVAIDVVSGQRRTVVSGASQGRAQFAWFAP